VSVSPDTHKGVGYEGRTAQAEKKSSLPLMGLVLPFGSVNSTLANRIPNVAAAWKQTEFALATTEKVSEKLPFNLPHKWVLSFFSNFSLLHTKWACIISNCLFIHFFLDLNRAVKCKRLRVCVLCQFGRDR